MSGQEVLNKCQPFYEVLGVVVEIRIKMFLNLLKATILVYKSMIDI